ncbi:chromate transporter [Chromohalobacter israelensis]|uniref:Chromate transporter n=1 Tax=Chromohalobacter israelensis (strain ATCC BAA-138 / DSM 3043 / CIP 106854 / NCIMB 13768 / 1H11) TaxID=290398 RepID=Q1QWR4_CHRI1|nr:chromate transporter [Chromohalobacter salexigens]ABE59094.1 Chromate transporter [Chromohalobacter salexigens DSM 3043]
MPQPTSSVPASQGAIFTTFLRIGLLGFGGGPAMIPLIHAEVVKRRQWMEDDAFADVLAIANTLPGPIATKMPGYIGYRIGGVTGCLNAVLAIVLPMVIALIALLGLFSRYRHVGWIQGMGQGVLPVVMVMMAQLTWDFFNKSRRGIGVWISLAMIAVAAGLILALGVHPGWVILALLVAAWLLPIRRRPPPSEAAPASSSAAERPASSRETPR